mmetsp:Transcript_38640/g.82447  ORF Transcript_38640/g.82447 Transcript_38640/m.82447 type:complete len:104 (-) Transcript_38640:172-483(-)
MSSPPLSRSSCRCCEDDDDDVSGGGRELPLSSPAAEARSDDRVGGDDDDGRECVLPCNEGVVNANVEGEPQRADARAMDLVRERSMILFYEDFIAVDYDSRKV